MYLHIGNGVSIRDGDSIGIFDLDTATVSRETKKFISEKEREGNIEYTDFDLPRSFILLSRGGKNERKDKIKLSRISPTGLNERICGEIDLYND